MRIEVPLLPQAGFPQGAPFDLRASSRQARQIARSWEGRTSRRLRKKIEMLFAHLKRILKLDRLRLRGPNGARDEFILAATAQNLRKMAKLIPMPA
jgi:DDE family transposase